MNTKSIMAIAVLSAGLALTSQAQIVGDTGDLILGFRQAANANDLVVDLGQASVFRNATPGSTFGLSQVAVADLANVFGAGWNSATNVKWGVFGSTTPGEAGPMAGVVAEDTVWATSLAPTVIQRTPAVQQGLATGQIYNLYGLMLGATANLSSPSALKTPSAAGQNGYTDNITIGGANPSGPYFGFYNTNLENTTLGTKTLELYELQPGTGPGRDLGTFTLSATGMSFTAFAAIPEPTTYAAILGVATLGFVIIRRRKQAQVEI